MALGYTPSDHSHEQDTRPSAMPCQRDLSMLQDVFMRWRLYVLGHDPRRLLCAEAEKQAALDHVRRLEHELMVSEARASHWQAEAERLRVLNSFSGSDAATAVGSLEAANPSVAKCVTQRLLHTITRLFSVLELAGAQVGFSCPGRPMSRLASLGRISYFTDTHAFECVRAVGVHMRLDIVN